MHIVTYFWRNVLAAAWMLSPREFAQYLSALAGNITQVISGKSLRPADAAFMNGRSVLTVRTSGTVIRVKQPDFALVRELYGHQIYFPVSGFRPPPESLVIDLGANVGLFSLLCAKLGAQVLAVEAQEGFIAMARENFFMNEVEDRVRLVHAMLGASTGVFACGDSRKAASHWGAEPLELSMADLLNISLNDQQQMIHLLKIDIEGSEFGLFENNLSWLDKILHIAMEVHPQFGDPTSLQDRIEQAGFRCKLVPSWYECGIPQRYPGFLFAYRIADHHYKAEESLAR